MKKNNLVTVTSIIISSLLTNSCYVCDPRPSDRFSFYITNSNKDLFIDTSYQKDSIKLFDQNNNNVNYQLPLKIDSSFSSSDSVVIFSTGQVYNYFNKNGTYKYLLQINKTQSVNISLQIIKYKSRKCGSSYATDRVTYDDKTSVLNNNIFAYQIKLD